MDANEQFEELQGQGSVISRLKSSYYSEEDLTSDIIGFYMGYKRLETNLTSDELKTKVRELCHALGKQVSLDVFDNTYGANGQQTAPLGQTNWRNWYPRVVPLTGCNGGLCLGPRAWPSQFSVLTALRIFPKLNGIWWWANGSWSVTNEVLVKSEMEGVFRIANIPMIPTPPLALPK